MFLSKARNSKSQNFPRVQVENPGPGEYNPKLLKPKKTYNSVFFSQTNRSQYLKLAAGPAPTDYDIKRNLISKKPYRHQGYSSSFQLPIAKKTNKNNMQELIQYLNSNTGSSANIKQNQIIGQSINT